MYSSIARWLAVATFALLFTGSHAQDLARLPLFNPDTDAFNGDWLVDSPPPSAALHRTENPNEITLANGLIARTFRVTPNAATVALDNIATGESILRGVKPEARIEIDGHTYNVGGLTGQPNYAFLRPEWVDEMQSDPNAMQFVGFETGSIKPRIEWNQIRHHAPNAVWPPRGIHLRMDYRMPNAAAHPAVTVAVHYQLYDALPLFSKWIEVTNGGESEVTLTGFTSEILAAVEYSSFVEDRGRVFQPPNIHVETDYAFSGMSTLNTTRWSVHWVNDPQYESQVNYLRNTPCLLEVRPEMGPNARIAPGETFESFRAFILPFDSHDRERNGLAQRRMYRTIAPWTTENPLMMHVRFANWDAVKKAIDQCAEVGFEMVILTFGSGFNIEDDSPGYVAEMKRYADYAQSKGIEIGGYSLLASRSIDAENDVVLPEGMKPTFGKSPCLESEWGRGYFDNLYSFYEQTGFTLLEHDGSYPGDACQSTDHPGHQGWDDSRWNQWRKISDFYKWCRAKGIYLNVPDYYYLAGSNKCGMGYRETNWSLPRAQQVLHTRQNIYDGTWQKTPSMGWMFVPLTEYHGGGEAATIEPLHDHRDHYRNMLMSNLALGVQACYRGPRLYDTDATRDTVRAAVDWFKKYRDILESDVIHGRRADGRDIDWMLHVNPNLDTKGMLVVFNPLDEPVERTLDVNLHYTGLTDTARVRHEDGPSVEIPVARNDGIEVDVSVPAHGFTWLTIE